ncbi:type II toxin-antitoxin system RelE/ParE family toxin [Martelella alba]|uniref:Toxin n=1 Tax=Martelella alba TaxID=2590451 RepID=A0A506TYY5_9HYPH|nr:type II toxin-antitoxin system RelE/ParE family toxin [Martelella alba]TPW26418.1 type II toxin-antitoxin system RelE/ParE family toxin [Martelella alba]
MTYRLTRKAEGDLIAIYIAGVEGFGIAQAERYHAELGDVFDLLADNPYLARERTELSPPIRVHPHGSHIILYRIEDDSSILIVRVRHAREDWIEDQSF